MYMIPPSIVTPPDPLATVARPAARPSGATAKGGGPTQRRTQAMADRQYLELLSRKLADEGKLIEAGWVALRIMAIADDAPAVQLAEMRMAFMAGAQHLFGSILTMLDPGTEETEADLTRMDLIQKELDSFGAELEAKLPGRRKH